MTRPSNARRRHARAVLSVMLARHPWLRDTDHVGAVVHRAVVWGA